MFLAQHHITANAIASLVLMSVCVTQRCFPLC